MSSLTKGNCSSSAGASFSKVTFPSAFSKLSAASIIKGRPEPPGRSGPPGNYGESASCSDGWQARSLQSLEGVVAGIQASADAVEKVRRACEEVSRENVAAAQAKVEQLQAFSETSGTWCWFRCDSQYQSELKSGNEETGPPHRLLR
jgi:hypothetical protein